MEILLLGLCLWASVATGLAWHFYIRQECLKVVCIGLGRDIVEIARGNLTIEITDSEVKRTYKEHTHGV